MRSKGSSPLESGSGRDAWQSASEEAEAPPRANFYGAWKSPWPRCEIPPRRGTTGSDLIPKPRWPNRRRSRRRLSVRNEDRFDLRFDLIFRLLTGDGDLLDDERPGRIEHAPLAEAELLVRLQPIEIAQDLGDVVDRPRLDLVHEPAIATVPRLIVEGDRPLAKNVEDLANFLLADHLTKTDGARVRHGNHDFAVGVENPQHVELLPHAGDVFFLDADNFRNALGGVYGLVAHLELDVGSSLHSVSLSDPRPTRSFNRKPRAGCPHGPEST